MIYKPKSTPTLRVGIAHLYGTYATNLAIQATTIISGIIVARVLGPVGKGELIAVTLWPIIISGLAVLGSNYAIARKAADDRNSTDLCGMAFTLGIALSLFGIVIGWLVIPFLLPDSSAAKITVARIFLLYIPLNVVVSLLMSIDLGRAKFRHYNITRLVINPVYLILVLLIWLTGLSEVLWFVVALLLANFVSFITRLWLSNIRWFSKISLEWSKRILKSSFPFFKTAILGTLQTHLDKILLLWLLPIHDLGQYSIALVAAMAHLSFAKAVGLVFFARTANLQESDVFSDMARQIRLMILLAFFLVLILEFVIPNIIPILYGAEFEIAAELAGVVLLGSFFQSISMPLAESFKARGLVNVPMISIALEISAFMIFGLVLIQHQGAMGACWALVIAKLISFIVYVTVISRRSSESVIPGTAELLTVKQEFMRRSESIRKVVSSRY